MRSFLAALILAAAACTSDVETPVVIRQPCDVSLVAIPHGEQMTEDDPLPAGSRIIATPNDFDLDATTIGTDPSGNPAVTLRLRGGAVDRFAAHTAEHIGDLIAIILNGGVAKVPMIVAAIPGGEISITGGSFDPDSLIERFSACVR